MTPPGQILSDISEETVLKHAEISTLRLISDTLNRIGGNIQALEKNVQEVRESVIRIEAQEVKQQLVDLRAELKATNLRVAELEKDRQHREGAVGLIGWLGRNFPWLVALGAAAVAYFQSKGGG